MSEIDLQRRRQSSQGHRLQKMRREGVQPYAAAQAAPDRNASIDCGWGRLIFAQTFDDPANLVEVLQAEAPDRRDIALYVRDPHVTLAASPQELFLDPSHTFRLDLATYRPRHRNQAPFFVRRISTRADAEALNAIFAAHGMVTIAPDYYWTNRDARAITVMVAEDAETGAIIGAVMGVDHARAFNDPDLGSSLWCLAAAPQTPHAGVGEALVRRLAEHFKTRGAAYLDLSVLHDNDQAIGLYEKLGFRRVQIFAVKRKNPINERLFAGSGPEEGLNPYATIIVSEALRRGIHVEVRDAEAGFFRLTYGGRSVQCREALSEFTSAVAMSICDDKRMTRRVVEAAGVIVPAQIDALEPARRRAFLAEHGSVVVKPARGEQGRGVAVGLMTEEEMEAAVLRARDICEHVILEACFDGQDLRLIVIDYRVVAVAVRRPAGIIGDGRSTARELIEAQSRRRAAATGGESAIPLDAETERCLGAAGLGLDDVVAEGRDVPVRRTANLHTGGTIHDVTAETHPALIDAAISAARAIEIPVTGIDLMVRSPREPEYVFVEANERPGLANHEPQPTAERFVDFLFPLSMTPAERAVQRRALP